MTCTCAERRGRGFSPRGCGGGSFPLPATQDSGGLRGRRLQDEGGSKGEGDQERGRGGAIEQVQMKKSLQPPFQLDEPITLCLEEVSQEVFELALHSLYTDQIHPRLERLSSTAREAGATLSQTLLTVDVYKLSLLLEAKRLEFLSIKYIEASISEENVLLVLKNASELCLGSLKDYCMRFIIRDCNYRKVVMSSCFETLDKDLMVQVIRRQLLPLPSPPPPISHSSFCLCLLCSRPGAGQ